jgi:hypothetical protein
MTIVKDSKLPNILLVLAFAADLLTPYLIWQGYVPGVVRWVSHAAILLMIMAVFLRMLVFNRIPFAFWIIFLLSVIGISTAVFSGQALSTTLWGWWLMYQFPLVAIFSALQPGWPKGFPKKLMTALTLAVALQVFVQIFQYIGGEIPGDNLAGTFGENGTGNLVLFLVIVLSFSLGEWIENRRWWNLAIIFILGLASSILGEMKLFYIAIIVLGFTAILLFALKEKKAWKLVPYSFILLALAMLFIPIYNFVVPSAEEIPFERYFYDPQLLSKYLNLVNRMPTGSIVYYDLGRNFAAAYGWEQISSDPATLFLGYGLGARAESKTLGLYGRALTEGDLGLTSGTSLLVIMQETGLLGMLSFLLFIVLVLIKLFKDIRAYPDSELNGFRYGLILFSIFLPLWVWYNAAWSLRIPMLLYWAILGYALGNIEYYPFLGTLPGRIRKPETLKSSPLSAYKSG